MGMRNNARRSERSLVCAIQALVGTHILVELRNDTCVRGLLDDCDDAINVIIKDSLVEDVQGVEKKLPLIFIRGSHIRFVHIPLNISISQAVEDRVMLNMYKQSNWQARGITWLGGSATSHQMFWIVSSGEERIS
ncbi:uncharacterized protein LOC131067514 isoform X2 [Cryptomeria japonica]|uniref:uncharacterized protein LOC131067514 isoform X2 n=1 Tax=Cryptomeria japonica TaxID=3369 RepID=UPI0027DAAC2A|nr:uncharacterized protein LOC131067514 isoform X2 [Cryptomeria japonica]